jgi:hypothetical protein
MIGLCRISMAKRWPFMIYLDDLILNGIICATFTTRFISREFGSSKKVAVSSNVDVFCGSHSISWNDLMDAVSACDEFGLEVHYNLSNIIHIGLIHTAQKHMRANVKWKDFRSPCAISFFLRY